VRGVTALTSHLHHLKGRFVLASGDAVGGWVDNGTGPAGEAVVGGNSVLGAAGACALGDGWMRWDGWIGEGWVAVVVASHGCRSYELRFGMS
jgi:hypothetical protein